MNDYRRLLLLRRAMKRRCYDPNDRDYKSYGARGITICDLWLETPREFVEWALSTGYEVGLFLDRKNNALGYTPKNCRWVTPKESAKNRRCTRWVTHFGRRMTSSEWAAEAGIDRRLLASRLRRGEKLPHALRQPSTKHYR